MYKLKLAINCKMSEEEETGRLAIAIIGLLPLILGLLFLLIFFVFWNFEDVGWTLRCIAVGLIFILPAIYKLEWKNDA